MTIRDLFYLFGQLAVDINWAIMNIKLLDLAGFFFCLISIVLAIVAHNAFVDTLDDRYETEVEIMENRIIKIYKALLLVLIVGSALVVYLA